MKWQQNFVTHIKVVTNIYLQFHFVVYSMAIRWNTDQLAFFPAIVEARSHCSAVDFLFRDCRWKLDGTSRWPLCMRKVAYSISTFAKALEMNSIYIYTILWPPRTFSIEFAFWKGQFSIGGRSFRENYLSLHLLVDGSNISSVASHRRIPKLCKQISARASAPRKRKYIWKLVFFPLRDGVKCLFLGIP